ncbi:PREDICTED: tctex1 domain-containing protein 1-B [Drosophila arizonae]|uniref:Tctex1 domain-containing protein 1-B n=1 Tax=Drosophila arizonae TaxID=7263 RepID=A0ABM1PBN4_DROAR|nr:PREDICTED: tctex1 domain-containing protein 1-B [Drosophila arizonae]
MASAAKNWSGLVTLCLGQEREKRQVSSQRTSLTKSNGVGALGVPSKPIIQYLPSYRMEPRNPLNKERLELTMRTIMNRNYNEDYLFHPRQSYHLAAQVSEEIKNSIKLMNFDRYRYIVLVTVGELLMQGLCSMVNFLWDAEKDGFVTYSIKTPKFIAVCTVFYLYYD